MLRSGVLGTPGLERGHLRGLRRGEAPLGEFRLDLLATLREGCDQLGVDAVDVGEAVLDVTPPDTEPGGQLVAELGGVDIAGGLRVVVEAGGVDGPPLAIRCQHRVRYKDVGVEQRVAVARGAVTEPRRYEPRRLDPVDAVASGAGERRCFFEVADRGRDRRLVSGGHLSANVGLAEAPRD